MIISFNLSPVVESSPARFYVLLVSGTSTGYSGWDLIRFSSLSNSRTRVKKMFSSSDKIQMLYKHCHWLVVQPFQCSLEYDDCIPCRGDKTKKKSFLAMALKFIRWWGTNSGALRSVKSPLCQYSLVHSDPKYMLWFRLLKIISTGYEYLKT